MYNVVLLIGGNIGDRFNNIFIAKNSIVSDIGIITKESAIYESEPWGFEHEQNFLNQVVVVQTVLEPYEILSKIHIIENDMGRKRSNSGYSARPMDIDILFVDNIILDKPDLKIPHIEIPNRRFTLLPLLDIDKDFIHPILNISINDLLQNCPDKSEVKIVTK
ncbi:MAG: 2-amino-4-hydroxy-6-hydroxymethyldihydropteridine diphosphokinase [Bacteroidota bacterium]|nr:2-amino-4-hydroxy-6-hydroxymethyldihydropteridine diphosphokinase [Bacteroidota bacterium]